MKKMDKKKKITIIILSIILLLGIIGYKTGLIVGFNYDNYFKEEFSLKQGNTTFIKNNSIKFFTISYFV